MARKCRQVLIYGDAVAKTGRVDRRDMSHTRLILSEVDRKRMAMNSLIEIISKRNLKML